jgi:anti-sigma B factor antagonist
MITTPKPSAATGEAQWRGKVLHLDPHAPLVEHHDDCELVTSARAYAARTIASETGSTVPTTSTPPPFREAALIVAGSDEVLGGRDVSRWMPRSVGALDGGLRAEWASADGEVTVRVEGELDMATVSDLDAVLQRAMARRPHTIVLDVSQLGFVDSSGLATLASWQTRARSGEFRLVLRGVQEGVGRVLDVSGMRAMFTTE